MTRRRERRLVSVKRNYGYSNRGSKHAGGKNCKGGGTTSRSGGTEVRLGTRGKGVCSYVDSGGIEKRKRCVGGKALAGKKN